MAKYNRSTERARLNILQTLYDKGAIRQIYAITTQDVDGVVGDVSRYSTISNTRIVKSLLEEGLVGLTFDTPMKIWLTSKGVDYLQSEDV